MSSFEGKTVLITGAAGGFGTGTARAFAARGAKVILSDLDPVGLTRLAEELEVPALAGDVADPQFHKDLVAFALEQGPTLDIAINNAGIVHAPQPLHTISEDTARRVIEVDLFGVLWAMQAQINQMIHQRSGTIVNVASVAGLNGAPTLGAYAAAKHGVVGLTKTAAAENAKFGLRINAVCPAFSRTAMVESVVPNGDQTAEEKLVRGIPMRRVADVNEIVRGILFAADPENSFMTGETITLDGGLSAL
ncbi:MAG: glucose 1-dehydrogenase [Pseudomonadota bacterium]